MVDLLLLSLAVWRLSSLFAREDGPYDIFIKIRLKAGVSIDEFGEEYSTNMLSKGLLCIWCNSLWFSSIVSLFASRNVIGYIFNTLALSALAIIIDKVVTNGNN